MDKLNVFIGLTGIAVMLQAGILAAMSGRSSAGFDPALLSRRRSPKLTRRITLWK